jgi:hypothetical protein
VGAVSLSTRCSFAVACAMAAALLAACSSPPPAPRTVPRRAPAGPHIASLAVAGRSRATLDMVTGTALLTIGVADFGPGGPLLRVSTPAGDPPPLLAETDADGASPPGQDPLVTLSAKNAAAVTVTLNAAVSWQLDLAGGTSRTAADLRGGQVTGISVTAGADVIDLVLPEPRARVPVQLGAGASQLLLSLPAAVPVRVTAADGAGEVSLEGQDHSGVAGGSVFTSPGWVPGATGVDIEALAGAGRIAVTARPS